MNWYVLHVRSNEELKVKSLINRLIKEINVLVPRRVIPEKKDGIIKWVKKIFFTGYVFVQLELTSDMYHKIRSVPGVLKFLGNDKPEPIPINEMKVVLSFCDKSDIVGVSTISIEEGSSIKVIDGPLFGLEGKIIKIDKRKMRARVSITVLGEVKVVELGVEVIQTSK